MGDMRGGGERDVDAPDKLQARETDKKKREAIPHQIRLKIDPDPRSAPLEDVTLKTN
jgi:hypothetical protein